MNTSNGNGTFKFLETAKELPIISKFKNTRLKSHSSEKSRKDIRQVTIFLVVNVAVCNNMKLHNFLLQ